MSVLDERKLARLLRLLRNKRGRGTELISLYIPAGKQISEVAENLREEHGKASNIKSRTTRKNVQEAITKTMQRLKLYDKAPENGLVIFCGAIPTGPPGAEIIELYELIPPKPVNLSYYSCDDKFYLDPLLELTRPKEVLGVILVDNSEATVAKVEGKEVTILGNYTSGIPGKSSKGGQSARRFQREREMYLGEFYRRIANHANEALLAIPRMNKVIIGGPGNTKNEFIEGDYLNYQIKERISAVVDTSYTEEQGVKEALEKAASKLERIEFIEERRAVQRFLSEIGKDSGLAVYGEDNVRSALSAHKVARLLLSEGLNTVALSVHCTNCGYEAKRKTAGEQLDLFVTNLRSERCPKCDSQSLTVGEVSSAFDEFLALAEKSDAEVDIISTKTEEGQMLLKGFGGVGALLKV